LSKTSETLVFILGALASSQWLCAQPPTIVEYPIPTPESRPGGITQGSDGNLWFTESGANKIGTITTDGAITEYAVPTENSHPTGIATGSDGNLWFTELYANKIGKITTDGAITEYSVPTSSSGPYGITPGPDGKLWFTESSNSGRNHIGSIAIDGTITEYLFLSGTGPVNIAPGSGGDLWFTEPDRFGRITTDGQISHYSLSDSPPTPGFVDRQLDAIALGPDGNAWATAAGSIWSIAANGATTSYPMPSRFWGAPGIAPGPDASLWFTENYGNAICRITTTGVVSEYPVPTGGSLPNGITVGPDGNIWFTEQAANKIGVLVVSTRPVDPLLDFSPSSLTFNAVADLAFVPPEPQVLTVTSSTPIPFTAFASSYGPWMTISPSDSLSGNLTINVTVNLVHLPRGPRDYTGFIGLVFGNVTQTVPVMLHIAAP
jgi:streptogramin lyase